MRDAKCMIKNYSLVAVVFIFSFLLLPLQVDASGLIAPANNLGLMAYWSFEDGGGTKATDFSGKGNTATLSGNAAWVEGKRGKALSVDGTGDNAKTGASTALDNAHTFTYTAWAKRDASGVLDTIIFHGNESSGPHGSRTLHILDDNRIQACVGANTGSYCSTSSNTITDTNWHYYTLTHDFGGDRNIRIYLDGAEVSYASQGTTANGMNDNTGEFIYIGSNRTDRTDFYFDGLIDEVRIYSRVLTAAQIAALYGSGAAKLNASQVGPAAENLVLWHTFDGGYLSTTTSTDRSGNGNNGTLGGGSPTAANGKIGQALNFDGSNNTISVANSASLNPTSSITISGWVYPDAFPGENYPTLVEKERNSQWGLFIDYGTVSPTNTRFVINIAGAREDHYGTSALALNQWQMITATYDGASVRMYKDAVQFYAASSTGVIGTNSNALTIGKASDLTAFDGRIDDVRIYNKALSAAEITQLYNLSAVSLNVSQVGSASSGLVSWHTFDGPYLNTTTSTDRSGQSNNGALAGAGGAQNKPQPINGKMGQALNFDGTDDSIVITHGGVLAPANNLSVSVWINKAAHSGDIVALGSNDSYWALAAYYNQKIEGAVAGQRFYSDTAIPLSQWTHVVMTYSADGSGGKIYVNGVLDSTPFASTSTIPSQSYVIIGAPNMEGYFQGSIDDVRIYNRVISSAEVLSLYNGGR